jgi:hypothetical protein
MDAQRLVGNIWIGSGFYPVDEPFDVVYDLAGNYHWDAPVLVRASFPDSWDIPDFIPPLVHSVGDWGDAEVLLFCEAGRNRAPFIGALHLIRLGQTPEDAISWVRDLRAPSLGRSGGALTNRAFTRYIMAHDAG